MDLRRWRMPPAHYSKKVDDYKQKLNYNQSSRSHPMLLNNESCELGTCDSKLGIYNLPRHNTTTSLGGYMDRKHWFDCISWKWVLFPIATEGMIRWST